MEHIILIEVFPKVSIFAYLQSREHLPGICALTVICRQHIGRIRLSEPARSAIANVGICRIKNTVCILDQTRFVHIYSGVKSDLKRTTVWVHKSSHAFQTPFLDGMVNQAYCTLILPSGMSNIKLLPQRSATIFLSPEELNNDADCTLILFHLQLEEITTRWMENYDRHS